MLLKLEKVEISLITVRLTNFIKMDERAISSIALFLSPDSAMDIKYRERATTLPSISMFAWACVMRETAASKLWQIIAKGAFKERWISCAALPKIGPRAFTGNSFAGGISLNNGRESIPSTGVNPRKKRKARISRCLQCA